MNWTIGFLAASMLVFAPAFAKTKDLSETKRVISWTELSSGMIKELAVGLHPDVAIECTEGTTLPIQLLSHYNFFSLKLNPNLTITIDKSCYLRVINRKLYISQDLVHWEKAKKYFHGRMNADVQIGDEQSGVLVETALVPFLYPKDEE